MEVLNSFNPTGMPPHNLILKPGIPVMLLRNLDAPHLCNGTRLIVIKVTSFVLTLKIITGSYAGAIVDIPRIGLLSPPDFEVPFRRLQFPVKPAFVMTINKSQGQTLDTVGLDLRSECFTHGQLYVGCSRVKSRKELFIYSPPTPGFTCNVVFKEILDKD